MSYKVEVKEAFIKECTKLQPKTSKKINDFVFNTLPYTENQLILFEKMTGYKSFYKKRFGNYRLGVEINHSLKVITILTIMDRKEIYRHFPPKN